MSIITIVGGGVAGLVAAIRVAERGGRAVLHEAASELGGRARTKAGRYRVNIGPHALYRHGAFEAWLIERRLLPPVTEPSRFGLRLFTRGRLRRLPLPLLPMARSAKRSAPADRDYRSWAREFLSEPAVEAAIGFAALPTFHGDPGTLSAAFVQERIARSMTSHPVSYFLGGWSVLIEELAARARQLGVAIQAGSKLSSLPSGPTIVATDLRSAAKLLGDASIEWPRARTWLFDVALAKRRGDPTAVLDTDRRVYASDYSARDDSLAPKGESLLQVAAGLREGESRESAQARIEATLDAGFRGWRERERWRHSALADGGAGPSDPPGATWRDRPAIERGGDVWLAGDSVAAPGVLSEVAFASGLRAADLAVEALAGRRRSAA